MADPEEVKWYHYVRTPGTTAAGPWAVAWVASTVLLQVLAPSGALRVGIALIPLPFFVLFLRRLIMHMRSVDELQRRIQLEALAIAFSLTMATLTTLGLLQTAGIEPEGGWSLTSLWIYAGMLYLLGRRIASRRYA